MMKFLPFGECRAPDDAVTELNKLMAAPFAPLKERKVVVA